MAGQIQIPSSVSQYLVYAIVLAAIAFLQGIQPGFAGTFTLILFVGAAIAAVVEFFTVYGPPGPDNPKLPTKTLVTFVVTAAVYAATWLIHQSTINEAAGVAGALLFLHFLAQELAPQSATPSPTQTPTPAPGPPS